jgi:hypothetical protein
MALWDRLRGLEVNVEEFGIERKSVDVSSQFTRVSTTVVLGGGAEGRGEDVTYTAQDHDWFPQLEPPGRTTLQALSAQLDGLELFDGEPGMAASRDYRRWAFESAALDLALRQNELSLGAALEREYGPVRFVVSTRDDAFAWLEHNPELELKLDPENDWDRPFMERLAGTGRVRVLDLKAYYTGTPVDVVPDPELYRAVVELFPDAVLEDASLDGECGTVLLGQEGRLSFDAPIHSVADVRALPVEPGWLNIKPSRFGTTSRLLECIEDCAARAFRCTAAASSSWVSAGDISRCWRRSSIRVARTTSRRASTTQAGRVPGFLARHSRRRRPAGSKSTCARDSPWHVSDTAGSREGVFQGLSLARVRHSRLLRRGVPGTVPGTCRYGRRLGSASGRTTAAALASFHATQAAQ